MAAATNEKGLAATNDQTPDTTNEASILPAADAERKTLERLRALAAMAGLRVHRLDCGGGFIIIGANGWCTRELRDLHALAQALRQQGVQV